MPNQYDTKARHKLIALRLTEEEFAALAKAAARAAVTVSEYVRRKLLPQAARNGGR